MKWKLVIFLVGVFSLSGCATQGFLGFIATTQYVENRTETERAETTRQLSEVKTELETVQADLAEYRKSAQELSALVDQVNQTRAATEELQKLAGEVEGRLDSLPKETIAQLVEILQDYLEKQ